MKTTKKPTKKPTEKRQRGDLPTFWRWAACAKTGSWPYLVLLFAPTRREAEERAKKNNARFGRGTCRVRRVLISLALPTEHHLTPGLPVERRASALGKI